MIPLDRVRELLSLAPGPHGGTLLDTSFVHDLARDVLSLADALATAERERDEARAERDKAKDTAHCAVVEWYAISQERDRNWTRYQRADDARLSTARRLRTAEAARDAALASADLSARAAVDAARELGHVAAAAVGERDTARSALDGLVAAVRTEREARIAVVERVARCEVVRDSHECVSGMAHDRLHEARALHDKATAHLDDLLSTAPPWSTVDAQWPPRGYLAEAVRCSREYLAAQEKAVQRDGHARRRYGARCRPHRPRRRARGCGVPVSIPTTAAEAAAILRDLARGREDGDGADVWPLYDRAEDAMAAVVALDDELATAQSHATHALDDAATLRARAEAAEAEVARLRAGSDVLIAERDDARLMSRCNHDNWRSALSDVDALRATTEGRAAPTEAEVRAHAATGGRWRARLSHGGIYTARYPDAAILDHDGALWWAIDRDDNNCPWPTGAAEVDADRARRAATTCAPARGRCGR